jgi:hypothetical protein
MKLCLYTCLPAFVLFGSMVYISINPYNHKALTAFIMTLDTRQQHVFSYIHQERLRIYLLGLIIGLCAGFAFYYYTSPGLYRTCGFTAIILTVTYLFYLLHPKKIYMRDYLLLESQHQAWANVYRSMMSSNYIGMILGALAYIIFCMSN